MVGTARGPLAPGVERRGGGLAPVLPEALGRAGWLAVAALSRPGLGPHNHRGHRAHPSASGASELWCVLDATGHQTWADTSQSTGPRGGPGSSPDPDWRNEGNGVQGEDHRGTALPRGDAEPERVHVWTCMNTPEQGDTFAGTCAYVNTQTHTGERARVTVPDGGHGTRSKPKKMRVRGRARHMCPCVNKYAPHVRTHKCVRACQGRVHV